MHKQTASASFLPPITQRFNLKEVESHNNDDDLTTHEASTLINSTNPQTSRSIVKKKSFSMHLSEVSPTSRQKSLISLHQQNIQNEKQNFMPKFKLLEVRRELKYNNSMSPQGYMRQLNSPYLSGDSSLRNSLFFDPNIEKKIEEEKQDQLEQEEIYKKLEQSFELQPEDSQQKKLVGEHAVQQYYSHYKKIDKTIQQNEFFKIANQPITSLLKQTEMNYVLPSKMGLIKEKGNEEVLNITNMRYGDIYSKVMSEGLNKIGQINQFQLSGNRITQKGAQNLLKVISKKSRILELANNEIGKIGCEHIAQSLKFKDCKIEFLDLEDNKLGDTAANIILTALQSNISLKRLNLSKNYLTDKIMENIRSLLEHSSMQELYLHWNQLKAQTGQAIFQVMAENDKLKVLDLSCNDLAEGPEDVVGAICQFLQKNVDVVHLDLSNNYFNYGQTLSIAQALESNKSIYGFHFAGNSGYVDSRQFLIATENQETVYTGMYVKKRIKQCQTIKQKLYRTLRDYDLIDCCWICEGWSEVTFQWNQKNSGQQVIDPLFIHFNFENYKACYIKQTGEDFVYRRMMPPGELIYMYSQLDDVFISAKDQKLKSNPEGTKIEDVMTGEDRLTDALISQVNFQVYDPRTDVMKGYEPNILTKPRTRDPVYIPPKKKKKRIIWTFPISLMYKWRTDDEELIKKCFDYDWSVGKINKIIKKEDELEQAREYLKSQYKYIKETYKNYASFLPVGDVWAIQNQPFWELVNLWNVIDNKMVTTADINIKWTATITGSEKGNYRNPERGLSRYQLMEIMVRIADYKYVQQFKTAQNQFEAIKMFWDEHCEGVMKQFDTQKWRQERYWNEECDYCLKHYKRIVDQVYKKNSTKKVKPGQAPFMCLDELISIIQQSGIQEEPHVGSSIGYLSFNLSMMTQVDELQSDRIFQMNIVEYYEALARIAEEASLPPHPTLFPDEVWTLEKRKALILGHKLEGLILKLFDNCCDNGFKQNYSPQIVKSFFCKNDDDDEYE